MRACLILGLAGHSRNWWRRNWGVENTTRFPRWRGHLVVISTPQYLRHQLRECPAKPNIKQARIADEGPRQSQDTEAVLAEPVDQDGDGKHRHDQRRAVADQVPYRIARQEGTRRQRRGT